MLQHRLLTPAEYRRMPWRNGAGRTTEIVSYPPGAPLDAFDWRVSVADVVKDGPFSHFAGIDRTIVVIAGDGIRLDGDGHAAVLSRLYEPYEFSGDDAISCTLLGGPVRDFNVLLRRGRWRGSVTIVHGESLRIAPARFRLCYAAVGTCECLLAGLAPLTVGPDHTLFVEEDSAPAAPLAVNPRTPDAVALVAAIDPAC